MAGKRIFISYSHDSETHKAWVLELATYLVENGIHVFLDQWDLDFGDDLSAFMERGIQDADRVLIICTDNYVQKANSGAGGVGYEKTIVTAEIMRDQEKRRKFIPIVRNVNGDPKLPTFFGAALYLDLSDATDSADQRIRLLKSLYQIPVVKPPLGVAPFVPKEMPTPTIQQLSTQTASLIMGWQNPIVAFSDRFSLAFPGLRGVAWFDDSNIIAKRLKVLLRQPLCFEGEHVAWWWRGPSKLQIESFDHLEGSHFLMNVEEINIRRIAAVGPDSYYQKFVYVETDPDEPTGLYPNQSAVISRLVEDRGYANEEYGLVDDKFPVSREEYDDGATIVDDDPIDISSRCKLRVRHITPYNFVIAPNQSPINNHQFDERLYEYLNSMLRGDDVFDEMCQAISCLPRKH